MGNITIFLLLSLLTRRGRLRFELPKKPWVNKPIHPARTTASSSDRVLCSFHIRSSIDLNSLKRPTTRSQEARNLVREIAKEAAKEEFRMPYVLLHAEL
jgi:hypothetical protein